MDLFKDKTVDGICGFFDIEVRDGRFVPGAEDVDGWEHVESRVKLTYEGNVLYDGVYRQGISCLYYDVKLTGRSSSLLTKEFWKCCVEGGLVRGMPLSDQRKTLTGWVKPKVADVLYSVLQDGRAYFDALTFEDWRGECGYDDSIKAKATYDACMETGRRFQSVFRPEEIKTLQEAFSDY